VTVNRRQFLRGSLLAAANVAILAACAPQPAAPAKPAESKPAETKPAPPAATAAPAAAKPAETKPAAPAAAAQPTAVAKPPESKPAADVKPVSRAPTGELKIGLHAKLTTLDPQGAQSVDGITHTAMQHVFDTLVGRDAATGNLVPRLATSWEAPDPTTWVFKLRQGVKFHDGTDLSADDVKASLERIIAQKGPVAPLFAAVEAVETPDPQTVRLKMKQPVGTIPASTTLLTVAPAAAVNTDGFFNKPIGTGPFKYVSWRADADLRVEANEQYWGGPPAS
jgi:peptide/nickel transport system substrate-binding protein